MKKNIEIKAVTWAKDSHGLFDYESKHLDIKRMNTDKECQLIRKGTEISKKFFEPKTSKPSSNPSENSQNLITVSSQNQIDYFIMPSYPTGETGECLQRNIEPYIIVRSLKDVEGKVKGFPLEPGHIIKLGRIEYVIIETRNQSGKISKMPDSKNFFYGNHLYEEETNEKTEKKACRVCLVEESPEDRSDFLVSPCNCKGSCRYIHFNCLKKWISMKLSLKPNLNALIYYWKRLECELCQTPLPKKYSLEDKMHELVDINRPQTPYILMENVMREKRTSKSMILLQTYTESDVLKLGRGHKSDLIISDISVSRLHATIKLLNDKFVIFDNNSKFGTLVLLQDTFPITNEKIAVQVGRTVITFVKKLENSTKHSIKLDENIKNNSSNFVVPDCGDFPKAPMAPVKMNKKQGEESDEEFFSNSKSDE